MEDKKNCGIITFHDAINYGAVLQAYALKKALTDYCNPFIVRHHNLKIAKQHSLSPGIPTNPQALKTFIIKSLTYFPNAKKHQAFLDFKNRYLYDTPEETTADFYITGSDQVWNYVCSGFDKAYFLDFADARKRNSYSASFGLDTIPEDYIEHYYTLLKNFNKISVRESTGCNIIKELLDRDVPVTLDPTLLLTKDEWKSLFSHSINEKPYLLVYAFCTTPTMIDFVNRIAADKNLQIIVLLPEKSMWRKSKFKNAKYLNYLSPQDWVQYFYNASFVVTNSFHGTVFSINFNRPFAVELLPPPAKVNSRITDMLKLLGLENQYISNPDVLNAIDYKRINESLCIERKKSLDYLLSIVKDYNE
ncbi:MAG: polysaccharide pyruvyl transferase family protein [Lachnospiraceae bacterium]|nr:polysaccharide pyruvyl transferase family protein [Lachnospiraceae bacterium]